MAEDSGAQGAKTYTQAELDAEVGGLKTKNSELLGKVKEFQTALEPWKGLDPSKVKDVLTNFDKAEAERQKAQGDWDSREKKLREDYATEHKKVVEPLLGELDTLKRDVFDAVAVRDTLEVINLPTIKGNPRLLLPILRPELDVVLVDGKRVTVVKGPDGKPRYHATTNALLTVEDRLKELRANTEYAGAFQGSGAAGGGAQGGALDGAGSGGTIRLTAEQASHGPTYAAAVEKVGGDYSKVQIVPA